MNMHSAPRNLFHPLPDAARGERFDELLRRPGCRIERIVSHGQASPPGFWYEQAWDEWVLLLTGEAALGFEDRAEGAYWRERLKPGDCLLIPQGLRHRVESTASDAPTVWLAVHFQRD